MSQQKISFKLLFILFTLLSFSGAFAQTKYSINGYIKDASSGEELIGASAIIKDLGKGTTSNVYGFYSLSLNSGKYMLQFSYLGYQTKDLTITVDKPIHLNVELEPIAINQKEVEIKAQRKDENVKSSDVGRFELEIQTAKEIPAVLGEVDILRTIQLLPGVKSAGEGSVGFYVRGGGADQNLVLLDEAVVFNTGHLFGFFSVFNADAVKNVSLIKGGMPAEYGGRLSSVVDVSMKEGNMKKYMGTGGIGLIASRLTVEGPLIKDRSSFLLSGRRTYIDVLISPFIKNTKYAGNGYYFYDLNTKFNYRINEHNRLFLSGYFGKDVFTFKSPDGDFNVSIPWGNATSTIRWNHLFNEKLFLNTTAIYNDYNFQFNVDNELFKLIFYSGVKDINLKADFGYFPGLLHKVKFGVNYTYHTFIPSTARVQSSEGFSINTDELKKKYAHETAFYLSDNFDLNEKIRIEAGLRFSVFTIVPPYSELVKNNNNQVIDTIYYHGNDPSKTYTGLEPRINIRYSINGKSSIKASYNYNNQYVHLVSNSTSTLPTDVWVPSSKMVKPQLGSQYSAGYFRNFLNNKIEASVEVYYKKMLNQIEFRDGYTEVLGRDLEWDFVFGTGESYGVELFVNKRLGKATGWVGYTWSKTTRHFDDLITKDFPAKFDRSHDLSVVAMYELNKRISFGATFIYGTGVATTLPISRYLIENTVINEYMPRNSFRVEPYHRLDISAIVKSKENKKYSSDWSFSIYNVYNHKNVFFIYTDAEGDPVDGSLTVVAKKVSLFPIIPSVTWNFKF